MIGWLLFEGACILVMVAGVIWLHRGLGLGRGAHTSRLSPCPLNHQVTAHDGCKVCGGYSRHQLVTTAQLEQFVFGELRKAFKESQHG